MLHSKQNDQKITLDINKQFCNNNCIVCPYERKEKKTVPYHEINDIMNKYNKKNIKKITLKGLEPTLNKHFLKITKQIKEKKKITLETNARIFYKKENTHHIKNYIDEVIVKFFSNKKDSFEKITQVNGSYEQTLNAIKNLMQKGIYVKAKIPVCCINLNELDEIFHFLTNKKINDIIIEYPKLTGNAKKNKEKIPCLKKTSQIIKKTIQKWHVKTKISVINVPFCLMENFEKHIIQNNKNNYFKKEECKICKYDLVCNGLEKNLAKENGFEKISPIKGLKYPKNSFKTNKSSEEYNKLELNVGLVCNNDCKFCISDHKDTVNIDSTEKIIKEIDKYQNKNISLLNILGGEPTLVKDLDKVIKHAKNNRFKDIHIITNGRKLCDFEYTKKLIESGLNRISVTIHGHTKDLQDKITQRQGSYEQTIKGILNTINLKNKYPKKNIKIIAGITVNKLNYMYLKEIIKLVFNKGINEIILINLNPKGNCKKYFDEIIPRYTQIKPHMKEAYEYCQKNKIRVSYDGFAHCVIDGYGTNIEEEIKQKDYVTIKEPDCEKQQRQYYDWKEIRQKLKIKIEVCKECIYYELCEGIWSDYVKHFGYDDFKPIRAKDIKMKKRFD